MSPIFVITQNLGIWNYHITLMFIGGHDVNANLLIRSKMYRKILGPWGITNRNMKGRRLIGFFSNNQLKLTNSFFKKSSYVTWRYKKNMRSPHILDVISVSENFFKKRKEQWYNKKGNEK